MPNSLIHYKNYIQPFAEIEYSRYSLRQNIDTANYTIYNNALFHVLLLYLINRRESALLEFKICNVLISI